MTRAQELALGVQAIWSLDAGTGAGIYVDGTIYSVRVRSPRSAAFKGEWVWDQVTIDGHECGNRFGGVHFFMIATGETEPTYPDFADRGAMAVCAAREAIEAGI